MIGYGPDRLTAVGRALVRLGVLSVSLLLLSVGAPACDDNAKEVQNLSEPTSTQALDAARLGELLPESEVPAGFEESERGPGVPESARVTAAPSLTVVFTDPGGESIALIVSAEKSEADARDRIREATLMFDSMPYGAARGFLDFLVKQNDDQCVDAHSATPMPSCQDLVEIVGPCDPSIEPPAKQACAMTKEPPFDAGDESLAFRTREPVRGKASTLDMFRRGSIIAIVFIDGLPGSDYADERQRLVAGFDQRTTGID